jgi:hypothetical protein
MSSTLRCSIVQLRHGSRQFGSLSIPPPPLCGRSRPGRNSVSRAALPEIG